jgi:hypothetical protein
MSWVYFDDAFPEHEKVIAAGDDGGWLWVCAIAFCNRRKTGRFIPDSMIPRLTGLPKPIAIADRLVKLRLLETADGGYRVHDYEGWQAAAMRAAAEKKAATSKSTARSEAGKRGAASRWQSDGQGHGKPDGKPIASDGKPHGKTDGKSDGKEDGKTPSRASAPGESPPPHLPPDKRNGADFANGKPLDDWDCRNALIAGGIGMTMAPGDTSQWLEILESLPNQGFTLEHFVALGESVKAGTATWWDGEWNIRTLLGKRGADGQVAARGLIRSLEEIRTRMQSVATVTRIEPKTRPLGDTRTPEQRADIAARAAKTAAFLRGDRVE